MVTRAKPADQPLRYSTDRAYIVKLARERGCSDAEILRSITSNEVYSERVRIIREWAPYLGLTPDAALDIARCEAIIS
jgi:hypothetical protein